LTDGFANPIPDIESSEDTMATGNRDFGWLCRDFGWFRDFGWE
jgi:hypothetical protein